MRTAFVVVLAALGLWAGYWAVGAVVLERGLSGWLADRAAEGWVADYADLTVEGFPTRFVTVFRDLDLADPDTGVAWQAPEFRIEAASARPNRITAIWPPEQTVASPFERIAVTAGEMRAGIGFEAGTALALDTSDVVLTDMRLVSTAGWEAALAGGRLTTARAEGVENGHAVGFEAASVRPADPLRAALDPAGVLPETVETLRIAATLGFDAPWDRFAIERARPQITSVDLSELRATWGRLDLRAAGALTVDGDGVPEGRITVKATNWREMLDIARNGGLLPESLMPTAELALELLAGLSGPPDTLDAPLSFQNGLVTFGPIPLGPAPRLVIR